jgi:outer membrane protein insertion porin family
LIYDIDEGDKVYVRKIQFEGNEEFDDRDLKKIMETSEKGFFSFITKSGLLDTKKLEFDALKIASFYHNHGYIKAVVGDPDIQYDPDRGLIITIEVVEGPQYAVSDVQVEGDLILPLDILLAELHIGQEKFFNREVVRQDTLRLTEIYADEGYAYAEVVPMTAEDDENYLIAITYKINQGKKVRFERINITGNDITRDKVIRRELHVIEGEYFSARELQRSTANLHRLGFFEDLEIQTKKGSREDLMVLDINVKEKRTGAFSIGVGYSTFDNVMGTFQISENNFRGYGQTLSASARLGSRTTEFDIRFTEPWLFDKPISAGFGLYSWSREFDEYTRDSLGGLVRFGFRLPFEEQNLNMLWATYAYDDTDVTDVAPFASAIILDQAGKTVTSSVIVRLNRDTRDKRWFTRKGSVNDFRIHHAGGILGGDAAFNKIEARTTWYFGMPWKTSFMVQGRGGYAFEREDGGLPIYQKFRIGGINTVRGFEAFSISPRAIDTGDRVGGETMFVANVEYRFPLVQEQGVGGVVFVDIGNVWSNEVGVQNFDIKKSFGAGIRWYSPVGPLRVEWAKIIDEQPEDEAAVFNFNVGGEF